MEKTLQELLFEMVLMYRNRYLENMGNPERKDIEHAKFAVLYSLVEAAELDVVYQAWKNKLLEEVN